MKTSKEITGVYVNACHCSECKWVIHPNDRRPYNTCPECGNGTQDEVGQYIYQEITYRWFEFGNDYNKIIGFKLKVYGLMNQQISMKKY